MRTERQMMELILDIAKADERIRAVSMEGSRANSAVSKDKYMDYDITYYVTEVKSFISNPSWILQLGTPLIVQEPDWIDHVTGWFIVHIGEPS